MKKKDIIVTSAVLVFAVTMIFATVAAPGYAASKKISDFNQVVPISTEQNNPCGDGKALYTGKMHFNTKFWDDRFLSKFRSHIVLTDPDNPDVQFGVMSSASQSQGGIGELPEKYIGSFKLVCDGKGKVAGSLDVIITVKPNHTVEHHLSFS